MTQIITGPFGLLAYHDASAKNVGLYPALNRPNCDFARGKSLVAANDLAGQPVVRISRQKRGLAAVAMFGTPVKREL